MFSYLSYLLFLSWIEPLLLYLKSHNYAQRHLGILLCSLLGVLFYILDSGLLPTLVNFVKSTRSVSRTVLVFFFE